MRGAWGGGKRNGPEGPWGLGERWVPLHRLLEEAWSRYRRPIFIGETSHVGVGRAEWLRELTDEVCIALRRGVPLQGICLYPIIDRFEWDDPGHWHNCGLWDLSRERDGTLRRVLCDSYAAELARCQARVQSVVADCASLPLV